MSLSEDRRRSQGWENLEVQHVQTVDHENKDQVPHAGKRNYAHDFDPAGGLERGEAAELVALEANGIFAFVRPEGATDQTSPGNADHEMELSFDDDANMIGYASNTASGTVDADGRGAGGQLDIAERIKTDPDVLFSMKPHNFMSFDDGATGVGGGATMHMAHFDRNYRDFIGGGPIADRHDELFLHVALGEHNVTNAEIYLYNNLVLHWDVFEVEERQTR